MKKIRVLVFPCGSEIGLELHKSLVDSKHIELFGASSVSSNHGAYVYKKYFDKMPFSNDSTFQHYLSDFIHKHEIDVVYPAHDDVVLELSKISKQLPCKTICPNEETAIICRSKKKTYEFFRGILEVPRMFDDYTDIDFPVFLKPDIGQGSKGTTIANNFDDLQYFIRKNPDYLVMELLPGAEYTIDCFTDRKGVLRFAQGRERYRTMNGISVDTFPVNDARFQEIATEINKKLKLRGGWFFQVKKRANDELVLLEVAPRIAGSMGLVRNQGVNLPLLSIYDLFENDIEIIKNDYGIRMDRALCSRFSLDLQFKNVYLDFDDCLFKDGILNAKLIYFIYLCRQQNIQVHLISKHQGDLNIILKKFGILELFHSIKHIAETDEKAAYIETNDSIFIDDSFRERNLVKKKKNIAVFGLESLDCLITSLE